MQYLGVIHSIIMHYVTNILKLINLLTCAGCNSYYNVHNLLVRVTVNNDSE